MAKYWVHWVVDDSFGCARTTIEAESPEAARAQVRGMSLGSLTVPTELLDDLHIAGGDTIDLHAEVEDVELKTDGNAH